MTAILYVFFASVALIFFGYTVSLGARPTVQAQFVMMGSGLALFPLSFVLASVVQRRRFRGWISVCVALPLTVPVLFLLAARIGGSLRESFFVRDLPKLEQIVQFAKSQVAPNGESKQIPVPAAVANLPGPVWTSRITDGTLITTIFVVGGFPVKHFAYVHCSNDTIPAEMTKAWPKITRRQPHWLEVSD